jgi:LPS sulfotransferase NodH
MTYNAEQIAFMLHEAIDQNREYKSWHVSTQHLMTLVERVVAEEREACAKVCEDLDAWNMDDPASTAAEAIRARSKE